MQQRPRKGPLFFVCSSSVPGCGSTNGKGRGIAAAFLYSTQQQRSTVRNQRLDEMLDIGFEILARLLGLLQLQG